MPLPYYLLVSLVWGISPPYNLLILSCSGSFAECQDPSAFAPSALAVPLLWCFVDGIHLGSTVASLAVLLLLGAVVTLQYRLGAVLDHLYVLAFLRWSSCSIYLHHMPRHLRASNISCITLSLSFSWASWDRKD